MKYVTNYPIPKFGDKPGQPAPTRDVEILDYDGDKYASVRIYPTFSEVKRGHGNPIQTEIKIHYIYSSMTHEEAMVVAGKSKHIVDTFSTDLKATIRDCLGCGCLVPGGPTRCKRCANECK